MVAAIFVLASLAVEAAGTTVATRWGNGIRFVVLLGYFLWRTDLFSRTGTRGTLAFSLRVSVWSLLAGFVVGIIRPDLKIGVEHIAFVSGFGLLALTVAARVTLGHSGNASLFFSKIRPMRWGILRIAGKITSAKPK